METENVKSKLDFALEELKSICVSFCEQLNVVDNRKTIEDNKYNYNTNSPLYKDNKPYTPKK